MRLQSLLFAAVILGTMAAVTSEKVFAEATSRADGLPAGVPYAAPADPVQIASIQLPSDVIHGGDVASATVLTSSNAAALTARIGAYVVDVPKVAPGTFVLSVRVPRLPFPSYRARIIITAIAPDGRTAQQTVSIKIRY